MMEVRTCFKCNTTKPVCDFYQDKRNLAWVSNKCKACQCKMCSDRLKRLVKTDPVWREKESIRKKRYYGTRKKPSTELASRVAKNWRKKYPEKVKAGIAIQKLDRAKRGNNLHHWSYNEEHYLDVIELNAIVHIKFHYLMKYDQDYKMYRTKSGVLLDTKEAHLDYFNSVKHKLV